MTARTGVGAVVALTWVLVVIVALLVVTAYNFGVHHGESNPPVCHSGAQTHCLWVDGSARWRD